MLYPCANIVLDSRFQNADGLFFFGGGGKVKKNPLSELKPYFNII